MTIAYHNSRDNEDIFTDLNQNDNNVKIANIASDEVAGLNTITHDFKIWRRQLQEISTHMRQATEMDTLLKVTVAQVREKIACDRALIYQFTSFDSGTVLVESRTLGWTPIQGETIPGIVFGSYTNQDYLEP